VEALDRAAPATPVLEDCEIEAETQPWWVRVFHNGFIVLPRSVGGALVVGALVSAVVMSLVPENYIAEKISSPLLQMVLTLAVSIPVYICSTAASMVTAASWLLPTSPAVRASSSALVTSSRTARTTA